MRCDNGGGRPEGSVLVTAVPGHAQNAEATGTRLGMGSFCFAGDGGRASRRRRRGASARRHLEALGRGALWSVGGVCYRHMGARIKCKMHV